MVLEISDEQRAFVAAILPQVVFDGWGDVAFQGAAQALDYNEAELALDFPRGALDAAIIFHKIGDAEMVAFAEGADFSEMRFSARIEACVMKRIEIAMREKEAVRRGLGFFALPQHMVTGSRLLWETSDAIWRGLGDTDTKGFNYYSKRTSLSAVYSSTLLYALSDASEDLSDTRAFLARRIDDVMQFEKTKSRFLPKKRA